MATTTLDLNHTADELIYAVRMYNSFRDDQLQPSPLCDDEAEAVIMAQLNGTNIVEPLSRLIRSVSSEDWDEANIFAGVVRSGWVQAVAAINEAPLFESDEDDEEEWRDDEDDENAYIKCLARWLRDPEFQRALTEHPEWATFLV